jgi:hypothetical protein
MRDIKELGESLDTVGAEVVIGVLVLRELESVVERADVHVETQPVQELEPVA